jgi:gamma-glutamylcyclotransferase (GGCT)/AIG2-like uncharacterized protein YtfP
MFYFAYGSNMNQAQMKERCPDAILRGGASLADYRLAFTIFSPNRLCGCADIVASKGDIVYGLLYQLTESDLYAMDRFEGHPNHYQRIVVSVISNNQEIDAYSYEVVNKQDELKPSKQYLELLQSAARLNNFPREYQVFLSTIKTLE